MLAIGVKRNDARKYELETEIPSGQECVLITDRTNFYPESGGQKSDQGFIINKNNNQKFRVTQVKHLKGLTFHLGTLVASDYPRLATRLNDKVVCSIDSRRRYAISLNHTGVHVLNHAIRKHFKSEHAIIQTNSIVSDDHFKFEFKFNEMLHKPTIEDLTSIQKICADLVQKSLPIYVQDGVRLETDELSAMNYPVRKLNDVLYPLNLRVVSLGIEWNKFTRLSI